MRRLTVALILASACVVAGACSSPERTQVSAGTSSAHLSPVADPSLDGLLLSPAAINAAVGVADMTVTQSGATMLDDSSTTSAPDCLSMVSGPQNPVYADSRWRAVRRESLSDPGKDPAHLVAQAVVSFPEAADAAAFLTAISPNWESCGHRKFSHDKMVVSVGATADTNGTLTATTAVSNGLRCGRALTVSDNVAIDITACGGLAPGDAAVKLAHQIADKVAKQ